MNARTVSEELVVLSLLDGCPSKPWKPSKGSSNTTAIRKNDHELIF